MELQTTEFIKIWPIPESYFTSQKHSPLFMQVMQVHSIKSILEQNSRTTTFETDCQHKVSILPVKFRTIHLKMKPKNQEKTLKHTSTAFLPNIQNL